MFSHNFFSTVITSPSPVPLPYIGPNGLVLSPQPKVPRHDNDIQTFTPLGGKSHPWSKPESAHRGQGATASPGIGGGGGGDLRSPPVRTSNMIEDPLLHCTARTGSISCTPTKGTQETRNFLNNGGVFHSTCTSPFPGMSNSRTPSQVPNARDEGSEAYHLLEQHLRSSSASLPSNGLVQSTTPPTPMEASAGSSMSYLHQTPNSSKATPNTTSVLDTPPCLSTTAHDGASTPTSRALFYEDYPCELYNALLVDSNPRTVLGGAHQRIVLEAPPLSNTLSSLKAPKRPKSDEPNAAQEEQARECTPSRRGLDTTVQSTSEAPQGADPAFHRTVTVLQRSIESDGFLEGTLPHRNLRAVTWVRNRRRNFVSRGFRMIPQTPERILDAPDLLDDFYLNLIDWSSENTLAVALNQTVYLWHATSGDIQLLTTMPEEGNIVTSVAWSKPIPGHDNEASAAYYQHHHYPGTTESQHPRIYLAIGTNSHSVQLWCGVPSSDSSRSRNSLSSRALGSPQRGNNEGGATVFTLEQTIVEHRGRVSALSWNGSLLATGGRDASIVLYDVRIGVCVAHLRNVHTQEVCGLQWCPDGTQLASGGNDNRLVIWDYNRLSQECRARLVLTQHTAAVKALAWNPVHPHLLASGGGTADKTLRFWNTHTGYCLNHLDTRSQVCAIVWNRNGEELVTSHGYSENQLVLWKYPSLRRLAELTGHTSRVLHLALSPDGQVVVSAAGDETIRFWKCFPPTRGQGPNKMIPRTLMSTPSAPTDESHPLPGNHHSIRDDIQQVDDTHGEAIGPGSDALLTFLSGRATTLLNESEDGLWMYETSEESSVQHGPPSASAPLWSGTAILESQCPDDVCQANVQNSQYINSALHNEIDESTTTTTASLAIEHHRASLYSFNSLDAAGATETNVDYTVTSWSDGENTAPERIGSPGSHSSTSSAMATTAFATLLTAGSGAVGDVGLDLLGSIRCLLR